MNTENLTPEFRYNRVRELFTQLPTWSEIEQKRLSMKIPPSYTIHAHELARLEEAFRRVLFEKTVVARCLMKDGTNFYVEVPFREGVIPWASNIAFCAEVILVDSSFYIRRSLCYEEVDVQGAVRKNIEGVTIPEPVALEPLDRGSILATEQTN